MLLMNCRVKERQFKQRAGPDGYRAKEELGSWVDLITILEMCSGH